MQHNSGWPMARLNAWTITVAQDDKGVRAIEYALIACLVAGTIAGCLMAAGPDMGGTLTSIVAMVSRHAP